MYISRCTYGNIVGRLFKVDILGQRVSTFKIAVDDYQTVTPKFVQVFIAPAMNKSDCFLNPHQHDLVPVLKSYIIRRGLLFLSAIKIIAPPPLERFFINCTSSKGPGHVKLLIRGPYLELLFSISAF